MYASVCLLMIMMFLILFLNPKPSDSFSLLQNSHTCVAKFTHTMLQFSANHVVIGSLYKDINIKLKIVTFFPS
jgi:hypothetical protein